jgi:hypothetical protein
MKTKTLKPSKVHASYGRWANEARTIVYTVRLCDLPALKPCWLLSKNKGTSEEDLHVAGHYVALLHADVIGLSNAIN